MKTRQSILKIRKGINLNLWKTQCEKELIIYQPELFFKL